MKFINLLILLLAIPPAVLSTIQLFDTTLPIVSPIYDSIVKSATDKVLQVTQPGRETAQSTSASPSSGAAADESAPESGSLRPVHIGIAGVSILIALLMFFGLSRRAHA